MRKVFLAVAIAAATAVPASAAITVTPSAGAVQPEENVLTDTSMTGLTVMGTTNQTNTSVSVQSTNGEALTTTSSNGQARFVTADGSLDMARIFLTGGGTFTSAEFNLFNAARHHVLGVDPGQRHCADVLARKRPELLRHPGHRW